MNTKLSRFILAAMVPFGMLLFSGTSFAHMEGFVVSGKNSIVMSGFGECVHTGRYKKGMGPANCGGKKAMSKKAKSAKPAKPSKIVIDADFLFDFDKSNIKPNAATVLDDAASKIRGVLSYINNITVTGHTDSTGPEAYNQGLSERRANSVKDYLTSKGVPANKITTVGMGESQPRADNGTRAGRAQNRRVEIDIDM
ncbi:MAG: hypothetical protein BMS9Abin15_0643 [Gammaproteobacteria bacterium]|nr:MAG: hypothetical protein BMS9Abin15_0643 [Gammaproteobacteria bacterium]